MNRLIQYIAVLCLALLGTGCVKSPESPDFAAMTQGLDSIFEPMFPADAPGAVVLVKKGDSIVYDRGFGLARLDSLRAPMTDSTVLCIASVSKQFAAVGALMLQERGRLSLGDTLTRFFPQYTDSIFRRISIAHLLSHTSGLPDSRPRTPEEWKAYTAWHRSPFATLDDYKRFALWEESCAFFERLDSVAFLPGENYEYQNPTFQLLLPIIEQSTGEKFENWMAENIFVPAGMDCTAYFHPGYEPRNMAHGYIRNEAGGWEENDYGEANFFPTKADGALYTTALDFLKWDEALYGDRLMSAASRRDAHTGHIRTDLPYTEYGYGFFIEKRPGLPRKVFHTGDNGGFLLYEGRFEADSLFYLVFATHPHWPREATAGRMDSVFLSTGLIRNAR